MVLLKMATISDFQAKIKEEFKAPLPKHVNEIIKFHKYPSTMPMTTLFAAIQDETFFVKEKMPNVSAQAISNYLKSFTVVLENPRVVELVDGFDHSVVKILHTWRKKYAAQYREEARKKNGQTGDESTTEEDAGTETSTTGDVLQKRVNKTVQLLKTYHESLNDADLALKFIIDYLETGFDD